MRRFQVMAQESGAVLLAEAAFGRKLELAAAERRRLVGRVQDCLRANEFRSVGIAELCSAVGAPERTLHKAFREYLDLPPVAFLQVRRIDVAKWGRMASDIAQWSRVAVPSAAKAPATRCSLSGLRVM